MLIAARVGMGVGGALMTPSTLALITAIFTDTAERQRAISLWAATTGLGAALGPIVGGLLLARFWWGSVFLINVPVAVLGLPSRSRRSPSRGTRTRNHLTWQAWCCPSRASACWSGR
jgi:MFS family permease